MLHGWQSKSTSWLVWACRWAIHDGSTALSLPFHSSSEWCEVLWARNQAKLGWHIPTCQGLVRCKPAEVTLLLEQEAPRRERSLPVNYLIFRQFSYNATETSRHSSKLPSELSVAVPSCSDAYLCQSLELPRIGVENTYALRQWSLHHHYKSKHTYKHSSLLAKRIQRRLSEKLFLGFGRDWITCHWFSLLFFWPRLMLTHVGYSQHHVP